MNSYKIVFCLLIVQSVLQTQAQVSSKESVLTELRNLARNYQNKELLSFNLRYTYSDQSDPLVILDSLSGSLKLDGVKFHYSLDSTETIYNEQFVIVIYKQDRVIFLSKPSPHLLLTNPVASMGLLLNDTSNVSFSLSRNQFVKQIKVEFLKPDAYKSVEYEIDERAGYILNMRCLVASEQLYAPEDRSKMGLDKSYSIVNVSFSDFKEKSFSPTIFNSDNYFLTKTGGIQVSPAYTGYTLFNGITGTN